MYLIRLSVIKIVGRAYQSSSAKALEAAQICSDVSMRRTNKAYTIIQAHECELRVEREPVCVGKGERTDFDFFIW